MKGTKMFTVAVLLLLVWVAAAIAADPPDLINYQGVLRDSNDDPENGDFDMVFRFYDAEAAGNLLLTDEHLAAGNGAVTVSGGLFNVALGSGDITAGAAATLSDAFAGDGAVYVEIQISAETLAPRVRVISAAYSLNAGRLSGNASDFYLDTSAMAQSKSGLLTLSGGVDLGGGTDDDLTAADVTTLTGGAVADALHTHTSVADTDTLDGLDSEQFLRSDTSDTFTTGTLTTAPGTTLDVDGNIALNGFLTMDDNGGDGDQGIFFWDDGAPQNEWLRWDELQGRFEYSNELAIAGPIRTGSHIADPKAFNYFGDGGSPSSTLLNDASDLYVEGSIELDNVLLLDGAIFMDDDGPDGNQSILFYDGGSNFGEALLWDDADDRFEFTNGLALENELFVGTGEVDQSIYFFNLGSETGESLTWDDSDDRFEMTDSLAITGSIQTANTGSINTYNSFGTAVPESGDIASSGDVMVAFDLEVGSELYLSSILHMGTAAGYHDILFPRAGSNEFISWENGLLRFEMSDDLQIFGTMSATGAKNFVQNHPYREDLEVVYTALEGNEATTFDRGRARLVGGVARIALSETFAYVTNPDLGLTAHVTPRGGWADLYVESLTTNEIVVRSRDGEDVSFDYIVYGLRIGWEDQPVLRPRTVDAFVPLEGTHDAVYAGDASLRRHNAMERYREMVARADGGAAVNLDSARALREAIGEGNIEEQGRVVPRPQPSPVGREDETVVPSAAPARLDLQPKPDVASSDSGTFPVSDRIYQDDEGNLYAHSFRPESGGLAGLYPTTGPVAPGDVVVLDRDQPGAVRPTNQAHDTAVFGIVIGEPGLVAGRESEAAPDGTEVRAAVAFSGVVSCKVDAGYGEIQLGDLLTTSPTPGHAMRAHEALPGTILGKAIEPLNVGTGTIRVLVMPR